MDITPLIPQGRQIIQRYGAAGFKVSGMLYKGAILVFPEKTEEWSASDFAHLDEGSFGDLVAVADQLDVILLGTGSHGEFFPPSLKNTLKQKGLVVEAMDTGAACRTYNVLMAEGRRVAAALLPL